MNNPSSFNKKNQRCVGWFGDPNLIGIHFADCISLFSRYLMMNLRSYIKTSKECFIRYPSTGVSEESVKPLFGV